MEIVNKILIKENFCILKFKVRNVLKYNHYDGANVMFLLLFIYLPIHARDVCLFVIYLHR